jgi:allophanate hydrolase subunit 1
MPALRDLVVMADQVFMYGIVVGAFAVLTGILFSFRTKRKSEERKSIAPASTSGGERKGAI